MSSLIFACGIALAVLYLPRTGHEKSVVRSVHKTLPVALFALVALLDFGPSLLVIALALGATGDWFLSRDGEKPFLLGMIAFALAHLAYIALMVPEWVGISGARLGLASGLVVLAASTELWLRPYTGALKWPVCAYVVVIAAMGVAALSLPESLCLATFGAGLFILSDFVLAIETFRLGTDSRWRGRASVTVWITYITAQALLLLALIQH